MATLRSCVFAVVACAACGGPPRVAPPAEKKPPSAPRKAHVTTALFDPNGGGAWDSIVRLHPEPAALLAPCYESALAGDPTLVGWMWLGLELGATDGRSTSVRARDRSPLPDALVACAVDRLAGISTNSPAPASVLLYVSLSSQ